jgi:serine protease
LDGAGENGTVTLTWDNPQDDDIGTISIQYGLKELSVSGTSTSAAIEDLTDGTEYTFTVVVSDVNGNMSPGVSISITPNDTLPPAEASDLSAIAGHESVRLTWTDPEDNDLDQINLTWSPGGNTVKEIESGTEAYTVTGLINGTDYTFTIITVDNAGNTSSGQDISGTPIDKLPPAEVTIKDAAVRSRNIVLNWSDPEDEDFDHVALSWTPGGTTAQIITQGTETYTAANLSNGTEYTFSIRTVDTNGNTSPGSIINATPQPTYILSGSWQSMNSGDTFTPNGTQSDPDNPPLLELDTDYAQTGETDQIIVRYRDDIQRSHSLSEKIEKYGKETIKLNKSGFKFSSVQITDKTVSLQDVLNYYNELPEVHYAEPDHLMSAQETVDDPLYSYQWNLIQLEMLNVWDQVTGDASVIVAVVDSGIAYNLSDIAGSSILTGRDFVNNDLDPYDDNAHGTHVAGTIAQHTNNSEGTAGMAYGVTLLPVKVLSQNGSGYTSDIAEGIIWAADEGADIINLSLGGSFFNQTLYDACKDAYTGGAALFAASGNDGNNSILYPAAIDEYVIAVGATDYVKDRAPYSNYGPELDIAAPGGDNEEDQNGDSYSDGILQQTIAGYNGSITDYTPGYYFLQGTSMACPHVSALAALIKSKYPDSTNAQIYSTILNTADDLGPPGRDNYYGYGLINPMAALDIGIDIYVIEDTVTRHYSDSAAVVDEWLINVSSGTMEVDILFDDLDGNLDLFLYDPEGILVDQSRTFSGQESISYYAGSKKGIYTIKIEKVQ